MKEFLQGRRLGFALRSHLAFVALGLGLAITIVDLMAWFGWGTLNTNGFVVASAWLCVTTMLIAGAAGIAAVAERGDVIDDERGLARVDALAGIVIVALYGVSAVLRSLELGAVAPSPAPFLLAIAGLIVLVIDSGLAANMYSSREWEQIVEEPVREHRRRRA